MDHLGTVEHFNLNDIGREEPTDFPPIRTDSYPTNNSDLKVWMVEYFTQEFNGDDEEVEATLYGSSWDKGADGALYREFDGVLERYSIK